MNNNQLFLFLHSLLYKLNAIFLYQRAALHLVSLTKKTIRLLKCVWVLIYMCACVHKFLNWTKFEELCLGYFFLSTTNIETVMMKKGWHQSSKITAHIILTRHCFFAYSVLSVASVSWNAPSGLFKWSTVSACKFRPVISFTAFVLFFFFQFSPTTTNTTTTHLHTNLP